MMCYHDRFSLLGMRVESEERLQLVVCYRDGHEPGEFNLEDGGTVEHLQFFCVLHRLEWPAGSQRMSIAVWS